MQAANAAVLRVDKQRLDSESAVSRAGELTLGGMRQGVGGLPKDVVQSLFNKYDSDGSGTISYSEFTDQLFEMEEPNAQESSNGPKSLTGKTCYPDNEWLKGSNGIFEGIFGGGNSGEGKLRPPSGPGIGGNFNRRIGQMG